MGPDGHGSGTLRRLASSAEPGGQGRHLTPALSPIEAERVKRAVAPELVAGPGLFPVPGFHDMDGKTEKTGCKFQAHKIQRPKSNSQYERFGWMGERGGWVADLAAGPAVDTSPRPSPRSRRRG